MGLITTTHNASVKLFKKNAGGKFQSFKIKNRAELYESKSMAVPKSERSANFRPIPNNTNNFQSRSELGSEQLSLRTVNRDAWRGGASNHSQSQIESDKLVASKEKTEMTTASSIATPSSAKSFLKRLRESPQDDDEGNVKLLNEFLQSSKNLKTVDSMACRSLNSGDADNDKEVGEISEQDKSDGEVD